MAGSPCVVRAINNGGIAIKGDGWCSPVSVFSPIELTEEILLKVSDRVMRSYFFDVGIGFYIVKEGDLFYLKISGIMLRQIKYVHQLQNVYFALTNKELEICF